MSFIFFPLLSLSATIFSFFLLLFLLFWWMSVRVTASVCRVQTPHWSMSASFTHTQIPWASVDRLWRLRQRRWEAQGHGRWASRRLNHLPPAEVIIHTHHILWSVSLRRFTTGIMLERRKLLTLMFTYTEAELKTNVSFDMLWHSSSWELGLKSCHPSASQLNVSEHIH